MARKRQKRSKARPVGPRERRRQQLRAEIEHVGEEHARRDPRRLTPATIMELRLDIEAGAPQQRDAAEARMKFYGRLRGQPRQRQIRVLVTILGAQDLRGRYERLAQRERDAMRRRADQPGALPRLAPADRWTPPTSEDAGEPVAPPSPADPLVEPATGSTLLRSFPNPVPLPPSAPLADAAAFREETDAIFRASAGEPAFHRPIDRWRHNTASNLCASLRPLYPSARATYKTMSEVFRHFLGVRLSAEDVKKLIGRALGS